MPFRGWKTIPKSLKKIPLLENKSKIIKKKYHTVGKQFQNH
jgi:hypothetical protein